MGREAVPGAAPAPVFGPCAEACADRIVEDVRARGREVVVPFDHPRREAVAEQVSGSAMALVESQRVDAVQAVEPPGEVGGCRLDDHVVVGGHQAEGVDVPAEARDAVGEE